MATPERMSGPATGYARDMLHDKKGFVAGAVVGTAVTLLVDPRQGRRRRAILTDRAGATARRATRLARRRARYMEGRAQGVVARAAGRGEFRPEDDRALANHLHQVVERIDVPTGDINVEVVDGRVRVRGQVGLAEHRDRVLQAIEGEPGVVSVENLLHLPGQPPPNKADAVRATS